MLFLDKAITRKDDIVLAKKSTPNILINSKTGKITGYGREMKYLNSKGYKCDSIQIKF